MEAEIRKRAFIRFTLVMTRPNIINGVPLSVTPKWNSVSLKTVYNCFGASEAREQQQRFVLNSDYGALAGFLRPEHSTRMHSVATIMHCFMNEPRFEQESQITETNSDCRPHLILIILKFASCTCTIQNLLLLMINCKCILNSSYFRHASMKVFKVGLNGGVHMSVVG